MRPFYNFFLLSGGRVSLPLLTPGGCCSVGPYLNAFREQNERRVRIFVRIEC